MSADGTSVLSTVEHQGFTITSNASTPEETTAALNAQKGGPVLVTSEDGTQEVKDATGSDEADVKDPNAVALGKKGGEASAAARKAATKAPAKAASGESAESAASEQPDEDAAEPEKEKKAGNPRHDPAARIAVLAREKKEAADRAQRAEQRLAEIERQRAEPEAKPEAKKEPLVAKTAPKVEDFATYEEFVDARAEFKAREIIRQERDQAAQEAQASLREKSITTAVQGFIGRLEKAAEADDTFRERTADLAAKLQPSFTLSKDQKIGPLNVIADEVITSEHGAVLLGHLSDNPEEFQRIAALQTPRDISRAMAKLEGRLQAQAEQPKAKADESVDAVTTDISSTPKESKAPPPKKSVTGAPAVADGAGFRPGMDFDEYAKHWNKKKPAAFQR